MHGTGPRGSRQVQVQGERREDAALAASNETASTAEIARPMAERLGEQQLAASLAEEEEEPAATATVVAAIAAVAGLDVAVQIAPAAVPH